MDSVEPIDTANRLNMNLNAADRKKWTVVTRNKAIVSTQLQKGGIRLAQVLNDALAP